MFPFQLSAKNEMVSGFAFIVFLWSVTLSHPRKMLRNASRYFWLCASFEFRIAVGSQVTKSDEIIRTGINRWAQLYELVFIQLWWLAVNWIFNLAHETLYSNNQCLVIPFEWLLPLISDTVGSAVWVTGISAYIAYKHRVHTTDNEAGCYHVIVAQDYGYVISL